MVHDCYSRSDTTTTRGRAVCGRELRNMGQRGGMRALVQSEVLEWSEQALQRCDYNGGCGRLLQEQSLPIHNGSV
ncbi:hypothetical protein QJS04_geneDACA022930 [Acorus gramineus]|uniref:Uncharacterized protein n=1 Tax=Acorus gramineus TaxID=55184 RepID=A0AAV9AJ62_ACOGR|nr:hypothetical protein QJS04_geneDACA022930 [Acorus gramineus]